jgi:FlaA1/EpsC-like NDP-sugar epimerase
MLQVLHRDAAAVNRIAVVRELGKAASQLRELQHYQKIGLVYLADAVLLVGTVFLAYVLRLSSFELPRLGSLHLFLIAPALGLTLAAISGVYTASTRYFSANLEGRIVFSQLLVVPIWSIYLVFFGTAGFPRSVIAMYLVLAIVFMILLRRIAAWLIGLPGRAAPRKGAHDAVLVFGASREGLQLVDALRAQGKLRPVAFIDTDYTLTNRVIGGLRVHDIADVKQVIARTGAAEAVIAKPELSRAGRRSLVEMFLQSGIRVKIMPAHQDVLEGKVDISDVRPIRLEDLLGRDPVPPERALMEKAVRDRVVMVTGAGGSIGSELVRQALPFGSRKLVLLDVSEFALFQIHREVESLIRREGHATEVAAILADVQDPKRIETLMRQHAVDVVLHAAAYKHVRLVQENASAGICNNIWGTRILAEAAIGAGVKLFMLISTDKAVRPTSVMGATKRVAEMVIQAMAARTGPKPVFAMVRFGNVLGSTGSVVPIFREQIEMGGPVRVTHPDVTRYFMLIPEAAQLVIQAAAMAKGGEVFVLDMGESVKIEKLAETMIELAGLTLRSADNPAGDIEIEFTGLLEGEKLHEELQIGNEITTTSHPRIQKSVEFMLPLDELNSELKAIGVPDGIPAAPDKAVRRLMKLALMDGSRRAQ